MSALKNEFLITSTKFEDYVELGNIIQFHIGKRTHIQAREARFKKQDCNVRNFPVLTR